VLKGIGATELYHANTVVTSCTFLEQGGLLSRAYVEERGLKQTAQSSDAKDKRYGIWDRVFVDHVDIHHRGGRIKGPNQYGPVLFILGINMLLDLPAKSEVLVTKANPVHWTDRQLDKDRWYLTAAELAENIKYGNFDKMLVIKTLEGKVDFPDEQIRIALDDPQRKMLSGTDAYAHAKRRLKAAAEAGRAKVLIDKHVCRDDCTCLDKYKTYDASYFDSRFL